MQCFLKAGKGVVEQLPTLGLSQVSSAEQAAQILVGSLHQHWHQKFCFNKGREGLFIDWQFNYKGGSFTLNRSK